MAPAPLAFGPVQLRTVAFEGNRSEGEIAESPVALGLRQRVGELADDGP